MTLYQERPYFEGREDENERKLVVVKTGQDRIEYNDICKWKYLKLC